MSQEVRNQPLAALGLVAIALHVAGGLVPVGLVVSALINLRLISGAVDAAVSNQSRARLRREKPSRGLSR